MNNFLLLLIIPLLSFGQEKSVNDYKNWTIEEKKGFLEECVKTALLNNTSNASEPQFKNYCECCLIKSMDKYETPGDLIRNLDTKWFENVSTMCWDRFIIFE